MNQQAIYTQNDLEIELLKNTNQGVFREFNKINTELNGIRQEMKTQYHWMLGLILGMYGMFGAAAISRILGVI